jgi:hypothetical protein
MTPLQHVQLTNLAAYHYQTWRIVIDPAKTPVEDIFRPQFWVNATKVKVDDRIRILASDKSYDFEITVTGKPEVGGGLVVDVWPRLPKGLGNASEGAAELVAATDIVKRELVASTVAGKQVPRVEQVGVDGWRVIGLDGTVASKNHRSESAANVAMSKMLNQLGIDKPAPEKPAAKSAA